MNTDDEWLAGTSFGSYTNYDPSSSESENDFVLFHKSFHLPNLNFFKDCISKHRPVLLNNSSGFCQERTFPVILPKVTADESRNPFGSNPQIIKQELDLERKPNKDFLSLKSKVHQPESSALTSFASWSISRGYSFPACSTFRSHSSFSFFIKSSCCTSPANLAAPSYHFLCKLFNNNTSNTNTMKLSELKPNINFLVKMNPTKQTSDEIHSMTAKIF